MLGFVGFLVFVLFLFKLIFLILLLIMWNFDVFGCCGLFDEKYLIINVFEFEFFVFDFLDICCFGFGGDCFFFEFEFFIIVLFDIFGELFLMFFLYLILFVFFFWSLVVFDNFFRVLIIGILCDRLCFIELFMCLSVNVLWFLFWLIVGDCVV